MSETKIDRESRSGHGRRPAPALAAHRIATDEEAIAVATALASRFSVEAARRDRERLLPWDEIEAYSASGLGAITVPKAFGGPDLSLVTLVRVFEILCAADPSLGQIPQNHFGVLALLRDLGSDEQKARFYADILKGERIGNAGPERGRNMINHVTTRITARPDGLRLTGRRFYSTGALFAHWIPTRAIDDEGRAVQVWARFDAPGVTVLDDWSAFGQRTTASGTVEFDGVPVAPIQVLPVWSAADMPGLWGPISQIIQAAIDAGIARAAIDDAAAFVRDRARPWMDSGLERASDDPTIIHEIGHLEAEFSAAQALLHHAAGVLDELSARPVTLETSALASVAVAEAKILTTEIALEASEKLFDLAGSSATRATHALDRHWRNARVHTLHDPVRWKYHLLGNYYLNGAYPARHQWN
ncbi:SfnB family sulfur acquisition oxidoreductase [Rhizobium azooxidifex]|uniref:SfnB family sulfur acquisition oxidoreductase n=1 Tax=Mycoplana azooxidifex TaxID=1636188 RepID=A0A7W6GJ22_9HYPH|nr:SfnB family sulfur acquisition oxidoreductase [Mycoplana azooxidifex]MBB3977581.1 SfnB family sulfur acquisition oxidoreductase [Mycoplana azooxidifex]